MAEPKDGYALRQAPAVGDGVTIMYFSDQHACTVISVAASGKSFKVRRDRATLLNGPLSGEPDALEVTPGGFCAHTEGKQRYSYEENPEGAEYVMRQRKDGKFHGGGGWAAAGRHERYDFNF